MKKHLRSIVVGALAAVVAFGGIQVVSAVTSPNEITVCVNKKDGRMNFSKSGKCDSKTQIKMLLNRQGPTGATGLAGATGSAGAAGATGSAGAAGATGSAGAAGASGANVNSLVKNICGANGITACAVGLLGPGGGIVFMTPATLGNTTGKFYEAAPASWSGGADPRVAWCNNVTGPLGVVEILGTGSMRGAELSAVMLGVCTSGAANRADEYSVTRSSVVYADWFLPSKGELNAMYTNLRQAGVGGFAADFYWSSSEGGAGTAWNQLFDGGSQANNNKSNTDSVRPVRSF